MWIGVGVAAVALATRYRKATAQTSAAVWLALAAVKAAAFDANRLPEKLAGWSLLVVAAGLLVATLLAHLIDRAATRPTPAALVGVAVSLAFALRAATWLAPHHHGLAVTLVGVVYTLVGLALLPALRLRELASLLYAPGLVTLAVGEAMLFDGTLLAAAWAGGAAAAVFGAVVAREPRLRAAGAVWTLATAGLALVHEAPPAHLLRASAHPGSGALAVVLAALAALAVAAVRPGARRPDALDRRLAELGLRARGLWLGGVLAVYAGSLGILELAERVAPGHDVTTNFQRGHAGVSAFWGVLGLALLTFGLLRQQRALRIGGFVLFGLILAKIFLYDLAALSSATRAVSFLAVGAVLLIGGFCYQRLSRRLA
jgi:hypothetical protein